MPELNVNITQVQSKAERSRVGKTKEIREREGRCQ